MSGWKPLAVGIVVWFALSAVVQADPIGSSNQFNWVAYFAGTGGGPVAPVTTSSPITNAPATQPPAPQAPSPAAAPAPVSIVANVPIVQPQLSTPAVSNSSAPVDAFINLGSGPYPLQKSITAGNCAALV